MVRTTGVLALLASGTLAALMARCLRHEDGGRLVESDPFLTGKPEFLVDWTCRRELALPLVGWTITRTAHERAGWIAPRCADAWPVYLVYGTVSASPLILWSVAALLVALASRRRRQAPPP